MNSSIRILSVSLLIILSSMATFAQRLQTVSATGNKYLISAKAGGVNLVEGSVSISRTTGRSGILLVKDEIGIGERVTTAGDSRAEVLLNPGSYLRVGPETSFDFVNTSLDDLRLNIYRGSAILEVIADEDFGVLITTPGNEVRLTRSGVYRLDVLPDNDLRLSVVKGKVFIGADSTTKVKAGRTALIKGDETTVAKFDKDADPLEMWSQSRAKDLAKANASLQRNALRSTLVSSFNGHGWNMYDSFGLWIFDPLRHSWCFLPFGSGWGSPYGYNYGLDTWNCRLPRWIYSQPSPAGSVAGPVNPAIRKEDPARPLDNGDTHGRLRPPYQQIENNERGGGDGIVRGGRGGMGNGRIGLLKDDGNVNPSMPSSSSPMPSMPSAPAPSGQPSIALPRGGSRAKPD